MAQENTRMKGGKIPVQIEVQSSVVAEEQGNGAKEWADTPG